MMRATLLALSLVAAVLPAAVAQKVYRCGPSANLYSHQPCTDGRPLDVNDPRSAAQRKDAREASRDEARQARELQRSREQFERDNPPRPAASLGPLPPVAAKPPPAAASKPVIYREPVAVKPKASP